VFFPYTRVAPSVFLFFVLGTNILYFVLPVFSVAAVLLRRMQAFFSGLCSFYDCAFLSNLSLAHRAEFDVSSLVAQINSTNTHTFDL
jgi:hypothetical protein